MLVSHADPLVLVCANLQMNYLIPERRHAILDGDAVAMHCKGGVA